MRHVVLITALFGPPLSAQDLQFDRTAAEICLHAASDRAEAHDCIGRAASACMAQPMGETTVGMGFCLDSELSLWDEMLNAAYRARRADYEARDTGRIEGAPPLADTLRDMQRQWIGFRDARCSFEAAQWHGGTGAGPALLGCMLQVTAEQALYLGTLDDTVR